MMPHPPLFAILSYPICNYPFLPLLTEALTLTPSVLRHLHQLPTLIFRHPLPSVNVVLPLLRLKSVYSTNTKAAANLGLSTSLTEVKTAPMISLTVQHTFLLWKRWHMMLCIKWLSLLPMLPLLLSMKAPLPYTSPRIIFLPLCNLLNPLLLFQMHITVADAYPSHSAPTVGAVLPSSSYQSFFLSDDSANSGSHDDVSPISVPHLIWKGQVWNSDDVQVPYECLLDDGAHLILIRPETVTDLGLPIRKLKEPVSVTLALNNNPDAIKEFSDYVFLSLSSLNNAWSSKPVRALIAPGLCTTFFKAYLFLYTTKLSLTMKHVQQSINHVASIC